MKVSVHLHTILQLQSPDGVIRQVDLDILEGSTVSDVLTTLGVTIDIDSLLIAVNGRVADADQSLNHNDKINLMPAISGG